MKTTTIILALLLLLTGLSYSDDEFSDLNAEEPVRMEGPNVSTFGGVHGVAGDNSQFVGVELGMAGTYLDGRLQFDHNFILALPWMHRQGVTQFSLQAPVSFLSLALVYVTDVYILKRKYYSSAAKFVFLTPNSMYKWKILPNLQLTGAFDTQYFFFTPEEADRGITFTPSVGLTYCKNRLADQFSVSLLVGNTWFWNFDGDDQSDGINVGLWLRFCGWEKGP